MTANNQDFTLAAECPANPVPVIGVGSTALLGSVSLSCEDCMALMRRYPDKHFDLAIVDPPYGIGAALVTGGTGRGFHKMVASGADKWDVAPPAEYFAELRRVSRQQIIWGGNYFDLPPSKKPLCWNKVRPNQKNLSEWEYAWTSFEGRAQMFTHCANGGFIGEPRIHPTQKPVELYAWLLSNFAEPGQRILDTHLGSGSHAIACHYAGMHLTACEIDADYFAAAQERIARETRQTTLF
jgi:site-specific DNA-methyltransferase (adenine-specific)